MHSTRSMRWNSRSQSRPRKPPEWSLVPVPPASEARIGHLTGSSDGYDVRASGIFIRKRSPRRFSALQNQGPTDRFVRAVLGLALLVPFSFSSIGLAGLLLSASGVLGFCPLYWLFGVRSSAAEE